MGLTRNTSASKHVMSVVNVIILWYHHCTFYEQRGIQPLDHFFYSVFYKHFGTSGVILLFLTVLKTFAKASLLSTVTKASHLLSFDQRICLTMKLIWN